MLDIRTISLYVLTEFFGDSGISFQQVFTGHSCLTGSPTGVYDIFSTSQRFFDIGSKSDINTFETAMEQLFSHPFQTRSVRVIQTNIRSKSHHDGCLSHIRTNHTCCPYDRELFVCQCFHIVLFFNDMFSIKTFPATIKFACKLYFFFYLQR